ncbi:MmcQ/YjbR family DNA-binding protein [Williamsia deligens]|uniref:MmcQ/YjbR family DNA-binding protein n=1 Tax=Williamsia deligens TaxID=321325 RepID=A0ABW3GAM4_9NOCA|nr:MmcQ/YjbR family DNA-binding protein [Williamsia deligens]MCP2192525.1 hypothetical protein [Williamsia deligens]
MLTWDDVTRHAASLPEVTVGDHHGMDAIRFRTSVLATRPEPQVLRIMLTPEQVHEAVAEFGWASVVMWGSRVSAVAVDLASADAEPVLDLLTDAWRRRAPRRLQDGLGDR